MPFGGWGSVGKQFSSGTYELVQMGLGSNSGTTASQLCGQVCYLIPLGPVFSPAKWDYFLLQEVCECPE